LTVEKCHAIVLVVPDIYVNERSSEISTRSGRKEFFIEWFQEKSRGLGMMSTPTLFGGKKFQEEDDEAI